MSVSSLSFGTLLSDIFPNLGDVSELNRRESKIALNIHFDGKSLR